MIGPFLLEKLSTLLLCLVLTAIAVAQPPPEPAPVIVADPPVATPVPFIPTTLDPDERHRAISVFVDLGFPTGVHVGVPLVVGPSWHFQVEGVADVFPIPDIFGGDVITVGAAGVAGRVVLEARSEGGCNAFRIGPGLGVLTAFGRRTVVFGTADVTLGWEHDWCRRLGSELGLYLGAGFSDRGAIPLVGLYGQIQF
jgi:hypothetical protein